MLYPANNNFCSWILTVSVRGGRHSLDVLPTVVLDNYSLESVNDQLSADIVGIERLAIVREVTGYLDVEATTLVGNLRGFLLLGVEPYNLMPVVCELFALAEVDAGVKFIP